MPNINILKSASNILSAGRRVNSSQLKTIVENIANAGSTATVKGGEPYARKIAVFDPIRPDVVPDPIGRIVRDRSDYPTKYDPGDPMADAAGRVRLSNVNASVEYTNLQAVTRSYELNMQASESIDKAAKATLDLLK